MLLFKLKPRRNVELRLVVVFAEGVGLMFLHAACCDVRFGSAGDCKCIPWEAHTKVLSSVSLVCVKRKGKKIQQR